jgi:hypothetical protein
MDNIKVASWKNTKSFFCQKKVMVTTLNIYFSFFPTYSSKAKNDRKKKKKLYLKFRFWTFFEMSRMQ